MRVWWFQWCIRVCYSRNWFTVIIMQTILYTHKKTVWMWIRWYKEAIFPKLNVIIHRCGFVWCAYTRTSMDPPTYTQHQYFTFIQVFTSNLNCFQWWTSDFIEVEILNFVRVFLYTISLYILCLFHDESMLFLFLSEMTFFSSFWWHFFLFDQLFGCFAFYNVPQCSTMILFINFNSMD